MWGKGGWGLVFCSVLPMLSVRAEMTYFAHQGKVRTVALVGEGKPLGTGAATKIDSMGNRKFGDAWNVEFSGELNVTAAGKREFAVTSDDGGALYVDGKPVVMNDGLHGVSRKTGSADLPVGKHQVNLLYFNFTGGHQLLATVKAPGGQEVDLASACTPSGKRQDFSELRAKAFQRQAEEERKERERAAAEAQAALIKLSPPEALTRSIRHILKTKPRAYKNGRALLKQAEKFVKTMPGLLAQAEKGDPQAAQAMDAYGKLKYQALVAENPYLDFDEALVVLSDKVAVKNNWLGTHVLAPKGYKNKIARFNFRTGALADVY